MYASLAHTLVADAVQQERTRRTRKGRVVREIPPAPAAVGGSRR
jgi:hypothetical protein